MKRYVSTDFVARKLDAGWFWAAAAAALAGAIALGGTAMKQYLELQGQRAEKDRQNAALGIKRDEMAAAREKSRGQLQRLDAAAEPWLSTVSYPWESVLKSIERLQVPGLRVVQFNIDPKQGTARLLLECSEAAQAHQALAVLNAGLSEGQRYWRLERLQFRDVKSNPYGIEVEISGRNGRALD